MEYIYTDELKSGLDQHNVYDVIHAAQKYNVAHVFPICVEFLSLDANNVLFLLQQAQFFKHEYTLRRCWEFVDQNVYNVIGSNTFLDIDQELLGELLGRDQLMMDRRPWREGEIALWRAALRWADNQCRQKGLQISAENRRQMLGQALYKIRIPLIKKDDFSRQIATTAILTEEEVNDVLKYHSDQQQDGGVVPADPVFPANPRT